MGRPLVVCVDDEPEILDALRRAFRSEPYDVRATPQPLEALEWLRQGDVDVLLADQRMPELRGSELLQLAQTLSPGTARVLLTAYPGDCLGLSDLSLVGKPWDDDVLRALVRDRLRERGRLQES